MDKHSSNPNPERIPKTEPLTMKVMKRMEFFAS